MMQAAINGAVAGWLAGSSTKPGTGLNAESSAASGGTSSGESGAAASKPPTNAEVIAGQSGLGTSYLAGQVISKPANQAVGYISGKVFSNGFTTTNFSKASKSNSILVNSSIYVGGEKNNIYNSTGN